MLESNNRVIQKKGGKNLYNSMRFSEAENLVLEKIKVRFRPVLVFGKIPHRAEMEKLKRAGKVCFHGKTETIRLIKCGGNLAERL